MSKSVLTLKIWDDRIKVADVTASEASMQISTGVEGQFQFIAGSDVVVVNSDQARAISRFLASNAKAED
jgi:protein involved in polysaccharide export with SLBB domain